LARVIALDRGKGKGKSKGTGVSVDGQKVIPIDPAVALREGLKAGQELPEDRVAALLKASGDEKCYNAALRYLGYRPLSESEMRQKLARRGFDEDCIGATIGRLREKGLMDDAEFARFWKDNRQSFGPRSRWLIGQELKQKGVPQEAIDSVLDDVDDSENAYNVGRSKARFLKECDYESFRRRLGDHLKRRGFGYGVIINTIERLWRERDTTSQE
jgi:regulatory protein